MSDRKKPIEQAVDLVVFAPVGFVLEARRLLPTFVERGRQQVNMAKFVGRFAVQQGQAEAGRRLSKVQQQAETVLTELGLGTQAASPAGPEVPPAPPPEVREPAGSVTRPPRASAEAASLPIADYDSLAASQVIPRLAGLDPAELEAVRAYELAHRGRKTILGKINQLTDQ